MYKFYVVFLVCFSSVINCIFYSYYFEPCCDPKSLEHTPQTCRIQVFYQSGMSDKAEDYELCMRAEHVELPKEGYFGVTAATGGLAGMIESPQIQR